MKIEIEEEVFNKLVNRIQDISRALASVKGIVDSISYQNYEGNNYPDPPAALNPESFIAISEGNNPKGIARPTLKERMQKEINETYARSEEFL